MRFSQKLTTELNLENYIVNEYMKDHIFEYPFLQGPITPG